MKAAEKKHLDAVASAGCVICGSMPCCIHHVRLFGAKRDHSKVIGLCHYHHQGAEGIHYLGKKSWRRKYGHETDYMKEIQDE